MKGKDFTPPQNLPRKLKKKLYGKRKGRVVFRPMMYGQFICSAK